MHHRLHNRTIREQESYSIHALAFDKTHQVPIPLCTLRVPKDIIYTNHKCWLILWINAFLKYWLAISSINFSYPSQRTYAFLYTVINHLSSSSVLRSARTESLRFHCASFGDLLRPRNDLNIHTLHNCKLTKFILIMTMAVDSMHNYSCSWCSLLRYICKTVNIICNYMYYFNRAFQIEEHCVPATGSIGLRGYTSTLSSQR